MANPAPAGIFIAVSFVVSIFVTVTHIHAGTAATATAGAGSLVSLLFVRAMVLYALSIADGRPLSVSQFLEVNVKQFFLLVLAYIAVFILLVIAAIPILIPWIWVIPWLAFTGLALVDKNLDPVAAMSESRRLADHHKGKVWGLIGWMVLVSIAGAILGIIPYLSYLARPAVTVVEGVGLAILYRWLQSQSQTQPPAQSQPPAQPNVAAV
jgi:hypothetical protein